MKNDARVFLLFLVSSSLAVLTDAVEIKLTNVAEAGTDIPVTCYNGDHPIRNYASKTLSFEQALDFKVYTGIWGARLVICDFKLDGDTRFFTIYSRARDSKNSNGRCWWHLKKDKLCMMNWSSGEYDKCFGYLFGSLKGSLRDSEIAMEDVGRILNRINFAS